MCKSVYVEVYTRCKYYTTFWILHSNNHISIKQLYNKAITHYELYSIYSFSLSRKIHILYQKISKFQISKLRVVVTRCVHYLFPTALFYESIEFNDAVSQIFDSVPRTHIKRWYIMEGILSEHDTLSYMFWGSDRIYRAGSIILFEWGKDYE